MDASFAMLTSRPSNRELSDRRARLSLKAISVSQHPFQRFGLRPRPARSLALPWPCSGRVYYTMTGPLLRGRCVSARAGDQIDR